MQCQNWRAREKDTSVVGMVRYMSCHPDICRDNMTPHTIQRPDICLLAGHMSVQNGFLAEMTSHIAGFRTLIGTKWFFSQNDGAYSWMAAHVSGWWHICHGFGSYARVADICHAFSCQIAIMVAHMSGFRINVSKLGCSHIRPEQTYALPFHTHKGKWQRICVPTTTYAQPSDENNEMSARVRRLAGHMNGFLAS